MTEQQRQEEQRLNDCLARIDANLGVIGSRLAEYQRDIQAAHDHMWEHRRDMDHLDKAAMRQSIDQMMRSSEVLRAQAVKLEKLRKSPYFGRFDFRRANCNETAVHYIGIHDFRDEETQDPWVYDWRAPVSALFYDFETGPAQYVAPSGTIAGDLTLKRQFRIRDSEMEFMLDVSLNIVDDVLQDTLAQTSDDGMRNIVATIQRDQNAIIRDAEAHTLIIQGVAGSGKTSIALHRIAFLLYRFKDTLTSSDILIISPNRVFADYIGNVLPELGEESVPEIGMETLAAQLLGDRIRFQTFFEQTALLLETDDEAMKERIRAKAAPEFLRLIESYAQHLEKTSFQPRDITVRRRPLPGFVFETTWQRLKRLDLAERIVACGNAVIDQFEAQYRIELGKEERAVVRKAVRDMVNRTTLRKAYRQFFDWIDRPELFHPNGGMLEYADVFPMIYLKMLTEGVENPYAGVKHLLVDEMQDYTPVQYAVLARLFQCRKTILGDATQSVNPYSASTPERIESVLEGAFRVTLNKSYRSTWEIMQFALGISPNPDLIAMERHGPAPDVQVVKTQKDAVARIADIIREFRSSDHGSLAVLAKTQAQARRLQKALSGMGVDTRLLEEGSTGFSTGVMVCTPHLAKGLEFDQVVIADASARVYSTEMDRNLLYVACTRAMHRLSVISVGETTDCLRTAQFVGA
ncbi:HelD family protein [Frigidibacter sp. ROC022]|uniref:HelD family protein n=1 Tax=Frigidibacter sp. ROC022 TaxID=2971796 RepID=UPI00215B1495|nr:3'-5' exonuclease [Frigidibacter sp. ROC022]MCR8726652.1 AAA family ATPase [Frigidibacter sp. ROC022]